MNILRNHNLSNATPDMKKDLVVASLQLRNIEFDEKEIITLSKQIYDEVQKVIDGTFALYAQTKPRLKGFNLNNLKL